MKGLILFAFFTVFTVQSGTAVYQCMGKAHYTFCRKTCCGTDIHTPGIVSADYWKECATPAKNEEALNATFWRVYSCIVDKALAGKPLTLENFAAAMTKTYSDQRKTQIMNRVRQSKLKIDVASPKERQLRMIREAYYVIEVEDCNSPRKTAIVQWNSCHYNTQAHHARGDCCMNDTIPIWINFAPFPSDKIISSTWTNILESVVEANETVDIAKLENMCGTVKILVSTGLLTIDKLFLPPNLKEGIAVSKPPYVSPELEASLNATIYETLKQKRENQDDPMEKSLINAYEQAYENQVKYDLVGIKDETRAKALFVSCVFHQKLLTAVHNAVRTKCNPLFNPLDKTYTLLYL